MFTYFDLDEIHLEPSEKCNAACPMCGRFNADGSLNKHLANRDWTLDDFKYFLPNVLLERLRRLRFCGNFGEPAAANELSAMIAHAKEVNSSLRISLHTNGGLRSVAWWTKLARHFTERDRAYFALDGLSDTHAIYRKQVVFEKTIENAKAFMAGGGKAVWVMLIFKHNEHQVAQARALSQELGFTEFKTKFTKRFVQHKNSKERSSYKGLEPSRLKPEKSRLTEFKLEHPIQCRTAKRKSLYISARGEVFPCCWTASQAYAADSGEEREALRAMTNDFRDISLAHYSLRDILESPLFQERWPSLLNSKNALSTCKRICGDPTKPFESQWSDVTASNRE